MKAFVTNKASKIFGFKLEFIYSENATTICEISTVDLTVTTQDKSMVEILQNFVTFSEYMNFNQNAPSERISTHSDLAFAQQEVFFQS